MLTSIKPLFTSTLQVPDLATLPIGRRRLSPQVTLLRGSATARVGPMKEMENVDAATSKGDRNGFQNAEVHALKIAILLGHINFMQASQTTAIIECPGTALVSIQWNSFKWRLGVGSPRLLLHGPQF